MTIVKRLCLLLIILDLWLTFAIYSSWFGTGMMIADDCPMAAVLDFPNALGAVAWLLSLALIPLLIVAYRVKKERLRQGLFVFAVLSMAFIVYMIGQYGEYNDVILERYNPDTVQSTMIEVDAAGLAGLQDGMVYCDGRPADEDVAYWRDSIKKNTDILVNNNHSTVYYYDTESCGAVPEEWGVDALPVLVLLQDGAVIESAADWDIVKYFQDTERFSYSW